MKLYVGTIDFDPNGKETLYVGRDWPDDRYKAPEVATMLIHFKDVTGSTFSFRLTRDGYDVFRQKVIETEGYPK